MKLTKFIVTSLMATTLLMSSSVVAFASDDGQTITSETVEIPVIEEKNEDVPLTPDANLSMVDDVIVTDETHKQFIIAQSKNGNYFYVVIDRTKDSENVYLLNMVDEADLVALANGETVPLEPTTPPETAEPVPPEDDTPLEPEKEEKPTNNTALIIILVLGLGGLGGAYYFFFMKGKNAKPDVPTNMGFDEDDEEDERYTTDDAFGSETENEDDENYYDDNDTEVV